MRFTYSLPVFLFLSGSVWAASVPNSVKITELAGTNQPGHPFTISRLFAQGDIQGCAQPVVDGVPPAAWQCDAKTHWPDGSLRHALISFRADIHASATHTVSFVSNANPCSSGDQNACNAASLDQQHMLNYDFGQGAGRWGARIALTASGSSQGADVRAIIASGNWTYWLRGPVVTQVVVQDITPARSFDFGWQCGSGCSGDYTGASWSAGSGNFKSLHPVFVTSFYPGYAGVQTEYVVENVWSDRLQDQRFSVTLLAGFPNEATVFTNSEFPMYARTRWHETFWNGATPGKVKIDYNLPYLIASMAVPSYDLTNQVTSSGVGAELANWAASDRGALNGNGLWLKYMPQTGGREDIGLLPTWVVRYLYTFQTTATGDNLYNVMLGNGDVSGYVPVHVREANPSPSTAYCGLSQLCNANGMGSVPAFGLSPSKDVYPQGVSFPPVATLSGSHGWSVDTAHEGSFAYIPYLITGDWFYLQELYFWSSSNLFGALPGTNRFYMGHDDWAYLRNQVRGMAWSLRTLGHSAVMAPDTAPEKQYFTQKLLNNIAVHEGKQDVRNGYAYTGDNAKWQWGYTVASAAQDVVQSTHTPNPLHIVDFDEYASMEDMNVGLVKFPTSEWQIGYFLVVMGHLDELGFPVRALRDVLLKNILNQLQNPAYNPWLIAEYRTPAVMQTQIWPQTYAEMFSGFNATEQARTSWGPDALPGNPDSGYAAISRAVASFLPGLTDGPYNGNAAWAWYQANYPNNSYNENPKWALVPRTAVVATPPASTCDLNSDGQVNLADVQFSINAALGLSSCVGDLNGDGRCNVVDTQRVVNAALGLSCRLGP